MHQSKIATPIMCDDDVIRQLLEENRLLQEVAESARVVYNCWTSCIPHYDGRSFNAERAYHKSLESLSKFRKAGGE